METSDVAQLILVSWRMSRQLKQHFIPDDPAPRHISPFRFPLTPGCEFPKYRSRSRLQLIPSSSTLIPFLWLATSLAHDTFKARELFMSPLKTSKFRQSTVQLVMDGQQKRHILQRVGQLILGQRTGTPIRKGMCFVQSRSMHPLHKVGIGGLRTEADQRRSNLGVEEWFWDSPGVDCEEIQILPSCMHDLLNPRITYNFPEPIEGFS